MIPKILVKKWLVFFSILCSVNYASKAQIDTMAGKALYFDGSTNYVDTKDTSWYQKFTVECWVKSPNAPSSAQGKGPVHYEKNFQINWDHVSSNARNALLINASNGGWIAASFGPLEANTWYHLAGTWDGDSLKAYKNGKLMAVNTSASGAPIRETFSLKIGKHAKLSSPQHEFFNGTVDEVRVWNVEKSATEIRQNMHHPLVGNEPGLKHYYQFSQFTADSVRNMATNKNVPIINNPQKVNAYFPFGKGNTIVAKARKNETLSLNAITPQVVSLQIDSANTDIEFAFTQINAALAGTQPDSTSFLTKNKPYWILNPFDSGINAKRQLLRLNWDAIFPAYGNTIARPGDISMLRRNLTSDSALVEQDTCSAYAWGTGHFIFDYIPQGQFIIARNKRITSIFPSNFNTQLTKVYWLNNDVFFISGISAQEVSDLKISNLLGQNIPFSIAEKNVNGAIISIKNNADKLLIINGMMQQKSFSSKLIRF